MRPHGPGETLGRLGRERRGYEPSVMVAIRHRTITWSAPGTVATDQFAAFIRAVWDDVVDTLDPEVHVVC